MNNLRFTRAKKKYTNVTSTHANIFRVILEIPLDERTRYDEKPYRRRRTRTVVVKSSSPEFPVALYTRTVLKRRVRTCKARSVRYGDIVLNSNA